TYKVRAYSEVDDRKFAEIQVKISSKSSPWLPHPLTPDSDLVPTETETPAPTEPTDPVPTTPVPAASTQVLKPELVDSQALVTMISDRLAASSLPKFDDVEGHWAHDVVAKGAQLGIAKGYQDGSFKPNASITRAEFVKMLSNVLQLQAPDDVKSFNDITEHWAKRDIEIFASLEIINGYGNGNFAPNQT